MPTLKKTAGMMRFRRIGALVVTFMGWAAAFIPDQSYQKRCHQPRFRFNRLPSSCSHQSRVFCHKEQKTAVHPSLTRSISKMQSSECCPHRCSYRLCSCSVSLHIPFLMFVSFVTLVSLILRSIYSSVYLSFFFLSSVQQWCCLLYTSPSPRD